MKNGIKPTRGSLEAEVAKAVIRFHREQIGRGPENVLAWLIADMVIVRSNGIFTPTEKSLTQTNEGQRIVLSARQELRSINHGEIELIIGEITGFSVLRSFCDWNIENAEQVEIFVFEEDIEKKIFRQTLDKLNGLC
jgi:uncharacterized protein YbcI